MSAKFEVEAGAVGGRVVVNGDDVSTIVSRLVLEMHATQPTRLGLELTPGSEGLITGEGIVEVSTPVSVAAWLGKIDGAALRAEVLEQMSSSGMAGEDPVILALKILKSWADGTPARA